MNVNTENLSDTRRLLTVTIPAEQVAAAESEVLTTVSRQARLPGFRPGKAPVDMVRRKFAREIAGDLEQRVLRLAYEEAIEKPKVPVFNLIDINAGNVAVGSEVEVKITLDLQPTFDLPEYKGIAVTVPSTDVTDEMVEQAISDMRRERAAFNVVERAANVGDYVKLSYTGSVEGKLITELAPEAKLWGTQNNTWEEAGATTELGVPEIVAGVVGLKAGDRATFTHAFGADVEFEALRGQTATYEVEVTEVRERTLPEFDEAFAKALGAESTEQVREQVRGDLERRSRGERREAEHRQIAEALSQRVDFPLPESALDAETQRVMGDIMVRNMQRGVSEEELQSHKEEIHANARSAALVRSKINFILQRIAEKESIKVTNDDISRAIMVQATQSRQRPDAIVKELQANRERLQELQRSILLSKTMDFLATNATATPEASA